jgi:hypothetical protein
MPLTESQIVRYSRQILLREVGGGGQERLLSADVRLKGEGAALLTAAAYVAGGGSRVGTPRRPLGRGEVGYLASVADSRKSLDVVLADAGLESVPESTGHELVISEGSPLPAEEAAFVHLGGVGAEALLVFAPKGACSGCVEASLRDVGPVPRGFEDLLGALAGLVQQRLALGLGESSGVLRVTVPGLISTGPLTPCAAHGS